MLKIEDLHVYYGGIHALDGVSLEVPDRQIISLIGANGAGKSTTLKTIMGLVPSSEGTIAFDGTDITKFQTRDIVKEGIVLCPEGRRVFPDLTVAENLAMGAYLRKDKAGIQKDKEWVYTLFPRLLEREWQTAGTLSGGEQQMLAVGRALMSRPKLLMMDEPSLGLAPLIIKDIFSIIKEINAAGVNVLLIEQNAKAALEIADYAYVLETGRITLSGTGAELLASESVKKAYLGE
ncbi:MULTISPECIES: ABC transporter ATP-binding protein [Eubacterium]|jgi:branched-chain amino acid transport system ATP-binding protein|uniref:Amino acid/amide ABC transporter ATP-binding protein 2, HAAT family n=1 Tax=Eubacterium barkeri TaxID=1528 RepID=A0A1H3GZ54_EUBBA|nr:MULTISPECIES: ABC transporter ATP-binding protein [Eubacterium]MDD4691004.1 ABC transporter ATP-binding protein [Eubacterium aggregans]SDY07649.1 amino acid/amide ABC transporter ATP-binding protein 2, HAAT family [Eubacterium barkeri]